MRNLLLIIVGLTTFTSSSMAFRDVSERSDIYEAVNYLIENDILKDGAFLRPMEDVPAGFFWKVLLEEAGTNFENISDKIVLPSNIEENDVLVDYIRAATAKGFIDPTKDFFTDKSIRRIDAIKWIVQSKKIILPNRVSPNFREKVGGVPPTARYLAQVEAAYASGILQDSDIEKLRPYDALTRAEFVQWLYNWHESGAVKKSSTGLPKKDTSVYPQYKYEKRLNIDMRKPRVRDDSGENALSRRLNQKRDQHIAVLEEVMNQIKRKYKFEEDLDDKRQEDMVNQAIVKMVAGLDDKYSIYVEPEKADDLRESLNGKFEGIGAYVEMVDNKFTITSPIIGSPAEAAGIRAGDIVTEVDGESIDELPIGESIKKIKGPAGTDVELTILRTGRERKITVTRGEITVPALKLEWKQSIPVVGIYQFSRDTGYKLEKMLRNEVLPKNPRGIIFDLRNNPGGFLTTAVDVGTIFLSKGEKVFSAEYKGREEVFSSKKNGILSDFDKPMIFLQNKGSASASEILTSMVQDYEIGTIMGQTSLGKGTVQEVIQFTNGGSLKLTVAKWISPKGRWIHEEGVVPDVMVEDPSDADRKNKVDRQVEKAIRSILGR